MPGPRSNKSMRLALSLGTDPRRKRDGRPENLGFGVVSGALRLRISTH